MKGFYYNRVFKFDVLDANDQPIPNPSGLRQWSQWQNAQGAKNKGLELIANQKFYFLPGSLKGLSVATSATFTDSVANYPNRPGEKLPTYGFSDYMFNGAVEYVHGRFRGRASYRYRSDYLEGIDTSAFIDDWFGAREQVDVELSFRLTKRLRVYANGENLTWRPQASYQGSKAYMRTSANTARATLAWIIRSELASARPRALTDHRLGRLNEAPVVGVVPIGLQLRSKPAVEAGLRSKLTGIAGLHSNCIATAKSSMKIPRPRIFVPLPSRLVYPGTRSRPTP